MLNNIPVVKPGIIAVSPRLLPHRAEPGAPRRHRQGLWRGPLRMPRHRGERKGRPQGRRGRARRRLQRAGGVPGQLRPRNPETLIAQRFEGPCMYVAAAEGDGDMINGRGDAYCGLLNCSYNLGMRHLSALHPRSPRGHGGGNRPAHPRLPAHRPRHHRREEPQDHHLRPPPAGLLRLQRPHQGPLRAGRGDRGKQRAGPAGGLQGARERPPHRTRCAATWPPRWARAPITRTSTVAWRSSS